MLVVVGSLSGVARRQLRALEEISGLAREEAERRLFAGLESELWMGNLDAVRDWADRHGYDLAHSFAYSDSVYDTPLLNSVGHPFVVNPDPRMRVISVAYLAFAAARSRDRLRAARSSVTRRCASSPGRPGVTSPDS